MSQGPTEKLAYRLTTTPWGSTPTSVSMVVLDTTDSEEGTDVTTASTEGSSSTSGDVITTKRIKSLTLGKNYRGELTFTDSDSNVWCALFVIKCQNK